MSDLAAVSQPWYRSLGRAQWNTLIASNLGWVFDGYETYALVISVGVALRQLLDPASYAQIPLYAGTVIALTLLGWGFGGLVGGRSEEHTSELQSHVNLVCRLLLEKKKKQ